MRGISSKICGRNFDLQLKLRLSDFICEDELNSIWNKIGEDESNWEMDDITRSQALEKDIQNPAVVTFDMGFDPHVYDLLDMNET